jgi:hypothetical protein
MFSDAIIQLRMQEIEVQQMRCIFSSLFVFVLFSFSLAANANDFPKGLTPIVQFEHSGDISLAYWSFTNDTDELIYLDSFNSEYECQDGTVERENHEVRVNIHPNEKYDHGILYLCAKKGGVANYTLVKNVTIMSIDKIEDGLLFDPNSHNTIMFELTCGVGVDEIIELRWHNDGYYEYISAGGYKGTLSLDVVAGKGFGATLCSFPIPPPQETLNIFINWLKDVLIKRGGDKTKGYTPVKSGGMGVKG